MSDPQAAGEPAAAAAEPAPAAAPVSDSQRNHLLDALRGVAVLGILLMNIPGFAMPNYFSESFRNDPTSVNFWVDAVVTVVFEGKMRALFGMLFGAGVILFVAKKERTGRPVTGLFYRRMFWLVIFGLIHAHLILWMGDILYLYGLCGMLVYLFRNVRPAYLALGVPLVAALDFGAGTGAYRYVRAERIAYVDARAAEADGRELSDAQQDALKRWRDLEQSIIPSREDAAENTRKMKGDYASVATHVRKLAFEFETTFVLLAVWDSLALMLLGVALYRWGFLTGGWSGRDYRRMMLVGYGLGLPLAAYSFYHGSVQDPTIEAGLRRMKEIPVQWLGLIYPFQRILLVLGHVSALILLYRAGYARGLFRRLEAAGQMAFTNYVMQSVICTLIFFGYGLNYYAELEYYQLYLVVLGIWAFQLAVSPVWLRYFLFGPLEWLWRSLTYWKAQPFVRRAARPDPDADGAVS
ncbi:MAG: DUF418 domain-containing protein [Gemmataceae bacterium]|nr:DUF418 domain-containing protein [Gemmataceae bacterium]